MSDAFKTLLALVAMIRATCSSFFHDKFSAVLYDGYMENYEKEQSVFTGRPIASWDLSTYRNLSYTLGRTNTNYTFCIFLAGDTIDLTASNR